MAVDFAIKQNWVEEKICTLCKICMGEKLVLVRNYNGFKVPLTSVPFSGL
jgi:hypothetical protein